MQLKLLLASIGFASVAFSSPGLAGDLYADFSQPLTQGLGATRDGILFRESNPLVFSADNGSGLITIDGPANRVTAALPIKNTPDVEASASFTLTDIPAFGSVDAGIVLRQNQDKTNFSGYRAVISFISDRHVLRLTKVVDGRTISLLKRVYKFPALPQEKLNLKISTTGSEPTLVRAKVWPASATEPTNWLLSVEDSEPSIQVAGRFASLFVQSTADYSGTSNVLVDDLLVNNVSVIEKAPGATQSFDATVLDSETVNIINFGTRTATLDLTTVEGSPTHIAVRSLCGSYNINPGAQTKITFYSDTNANLLELTACQSGGNPDDITVTGTDKIIPIPTGATSIGLYATIRGYPSATGGTSTITAEVLGLPK